MFSSCRPGARQAAVTPQALAQHPTNKTKPHHAAEQTWPFAPKSEVDSAGYLAPEELNPTYHGPQPAAEGTAGSKPASAAPQHQASAQPPSALPPGATALQEPPPQRQGVPPRNSSLRNSARSSANSSLPPVRSGGRPSVPPSAQSQGFGPSAYQNSYTQQRNSQSGQARGPAPRQQSSQAYDPVRGPFPWDWDSKGPIPADNRAGQGQQQQQQQKQQQQATWLRNSWDAPPNKQVRPWYLW